MPCKMNYLDNGLGHLFTLEGDFTAKEFHTALEHLYQEPDEVLRKIVYNITDYTNVDTIESTQDEVKAIAELSLKNIDRTPNVLIATIASDETAFTLSRLWGIYTDEAPWNIEVFREKDEAYAWVARTLEEKYLITDLNFK